MDQFHKMKRGKYGVETRCKQCRSEQGKRYRSENREEFRSYKKKYYEDNLERERDRRRAYKTRNRDKILESKKDYQRRNKDKYRDYSHRRRSKQRSLPTESFSRTEIFDRDEWVCQLCGDMVDPDLQWPHPWSVSLDHVIPLSNPTCPGHVWDNVWTTHLRCNLSKNDNLLEHERGGAND